MPAPEQAKPQTQRGCRFCQERIEAIGFKEMKLIGRYLDSYGRIEPRRRSGLCARHQRLCAEAVKRSRFMALLPYTLR